MVCLLIAFSLMVNQEKQVRTALQTRAVAHESAPVASERTDTGRPNDRQPYGSKAIC